MGTDGARKKIGIFFIALVLFHLLQSGSLFFLSFCFIFIAAIAMNANFATDSTSARYKSNALLRRLRGGTGKSREERSAREATAFRAIRDDMHSPFTCSLVKRVVAI